MVEHNERKFLTLLASDPNELQILKIYTFVNRWYQAIGGGLHYGRAKRKQIFCTSTSDPN